MSFTSRAWEIARPIMKNAALLYRDGRTAPLPVNRKPPGSGFQKPELEWRPEEWGLRAPPPPPHPPPVLPELRSQADSDFGAPSFFYYSFLLSEVLVVLEPMAIFCPSIFLFDGGGAPLILAGDVGCFKLCETWNKILRQEVRLRP